MPRTYVRKKLKSYTSQDLATAVEKVRSGELTQYTAAQAYNIPLTTIHDHVVWDAKLVEWQRKNIGTKMPKKFFAQTLADTWQQTSPEIIRSGFKKAGIYPFNDKVIPVDKFDPEAYKRYQKMVKERDLAHLKTPKTLKQICIDILNKLPKDECYEKSITDEVTSLSLMSKSDIQNLSFVAKNRAELPICLQNKATQSQAQNSPKVNIISNNIIKEASVRTQKPVQIQSQRISFEELMLRKIQQDKKETTSTKNKRISKGAEVITAAVGKSLLEMEITKKTKTNNNNKKKVTKLIETNDKEIEQAGPSGIQKKNKRKRPPSSNSTTSISDIISKHSDSDIIDCNEFDDDDPFDSYCDDEEPNTQKHIKHRKGIKRFQKSKENNIVPDKPPCAKSSKGKGRGKKSKGKENDSTIINVSEADKKEREEKEEVIKELQKEEELQT